MLGMVVATLGLVHDPFERREMRAGLGELLREGAAGFDAAESAGHDLHGDDAHAGLSGGVDGLIHRGVHGKVVGGENDVEDALLDHPWDELRLAAVGADAGEAHFALLLGELLRFDMVVSDVGGAAPAVEIPDVDVIGVELAQALVRDAAACPLYRGACVLVERTTCLRLAPRAAPTMRSLLPC